MMRASGLSIVAPIDGIPGIDPGGRKGEPMHAQVVTFELNGITEEQFHDASSADAPMFATLPGLLAKFWLRDPKTNTCGGVYIWADQETYEGYINGEIFNAIKGDEHLKNVESHDFAVFDDLSAITTPGLRAVQAANTPQTTAVQ